MRSSLLGPILRVGIVGILLSASALAVEVTLTGAGPANLGGVYTGPYTATVGGVTGVKVICDDYLNDTWINESWNAIATPLSQLPSGNVLWNTGAGNESTQVANYITAALLATKLLSVNPLSLDAKLISYAIWGIWVGSALDKIPGYKTQVLDIISDYKVLAAAKTVNDFPNVTIYTADPKSAASVTTCPTGKTCGTPQELIVVKTPEGPSLAILAADLLGLLGLILFAKRHATAAR